MSASANDAGSWVIAMPPTEAGRTASSDGSRVTVAPDGATISVGAAGDAPPGIVGSDVDPAAEGLVAATDAPAAEAVGLVAGLEPHAAMDSDASSSDASAARLTRAPAA